MTDYYVQIRKGGAWHRWNGHALNAFVKCGERAAEVGVWDSPIWHAKSTEPQHPLCKRCEKIAEKEKR